MNNHGHDSEMTPEDVAELVHQEARMALQFRISRIEYECKTCRVQGVLDREAHLDSQSHLRNEKLRGSKN